MEIKLLNNCTIKAQWVVYCNSHGCTSLYLYGNSKESPSTYPLDQDIIEDSVICIKDNILTFSGKRRFFHFTPWGEEISEEESAKYSNPKTGYKFNWLFWRPKKKYYYLNSGWHRMNKTTDFYISTNVWKISGDLKEFGIKIEKNEDEKNA